MSKLNLKGKLIILFLLTGLIPVLVVGLLSYNTAQNELTDQVFAALDMYAGLTDGEIEQFFDEREGDARVFASSSDVYQSINILSDNNWNTEHFRWQDSVETLENFAPAMVADYGYAFAYLTDPEGSVVYSTREEVIGADLSDRDYISAALRGEEAWSELFYSDVINENALVVSVPVFSQGRSGGDIIGTANLLLDQNNIDNIVHEGLNELGETADAYLIDANGMLLTNTLLGEYTHDSALQQSIDTRAVELLAGPIRQADMNFHYDDQYPDYLGNQVLGALEVTMLGDQPVGLIVEVDYDEAFAGLFQLRNFMIILILIIIAAIIVAAYFVARSIASPIAIATDHVALIADGDLSKDVPEIIMKRNDELGTMGTAFAEMTTKLREMIGNISKSAGETSSTSQELSASVQETSSSIEHVASSSEEMSSSAEEVAASVEQFASTSEEMSKNSEEMAIAADRVEKLAQDGLEKMNNTEQTMEDILNSSRESIESMNQLNNASEEINSVIEVISGIAEQTNLLALNAAIEAARAGEQGRSFAVVADEIRELAEETQDSTGNIQKLIKSLIEHTRKTAETIENSNQQIETGAKTVDETGEAFNEITDRVEKIVADIQDVASGAEELSASSEEIASVTEEQSASSEEVSSAAEQQSAAMQQINASSQHLSEMAEELQNMVARFKLEEGV